MIAFFHTNFDFLCFLYGLSFLLLATICLTLYRRPERAVAWGCLGWFALCHGLHEWLETLSLGLAKTALLEVFSLLFLSLSYLFLVEFGRAGRPAPNGPKVGRWILAPLTALSLLGGFAGAPGLFATTRYILGLTGGLWAGFTLFTTASGEQIGRLPLRTAGLTLMLYGLATGLVVSPAPFFPASHINADSFQALTGFPIQVGRGFLAALLTVCLALFRQLTLGLETDAHTRRIRRSLLLGGAGVLLLILSLGWLLTQKWGQDTRRQLHQEYGFHTRMLYQVLLDKMRETDQLAQALAGSPEVIRAFSDRSPQALEPVNALLDRFSQVLPLSVCYLMNLQGLTVASSNRHQPDSFLGRSYAFRPYFKMAEAGSPGRYLALGATSRERGYYSSYPVWGPQGNILGVAVIKRPLLCPESLFHQDCLSFLIDPHGIIFLSNRQDLVLKSLWPLSDEVYRKVAASRQFGDGPFPPLLDQKPPPQGDILFQGRPFMMLRLPFPYDGWSLVHLGPVAPVALSRLLAISATLILCLALLGLLLGWDLSIEATARLRKSERDYLQGLQQREEQYRRLFAEAGDGILIVDTGGQILDANHKMLELLGYSREELLSLHYTHLHPPDTLESVTHAFEYTVRHGSGTLTGAWVLSKGGQSIPVEISASQITYGGRTVIQGIFRDISLRRKSEEERLRLSKLESLGVLAGGIAHDFNNILTAILGNLSLAMISSPLPEAAQERLKQAEQACLRARGLAQQLLTFAKGCRPIKKLTALNNLLHEAAAFTLSGSRSSCPLSLPDHLWPAEVDEGQLSQVINNLLINADQAMPQGGVINLEAENLHLPPNSGLPLPPGNYVRISVADHGIGIPENYLDKIFDPYFTTKKEGSGLGLATAYSIIHNHHGHITVDSQPGVGTRFTIYLPAADTPPPPTQEAPLEPVSGQGKILIMDDDDMVRHVLGKMLSRLNYQVEAAADGLEALRLLKTAQAAGHPFKAVILDLTVPGGLGGLEAIQEVRRLDPHIKALVSSGYSDDPVMADFKKHGFDGVIPKPYKIQQLSRILAEVLGT